MPMPLPSRQHLKHYHMFYLIDNPYFRDNRRAEDYLHKGGVTYLRNAPKPVFEAPPIVEDKWYSSRKERRKNRFKAVQEDLQDEQRLINQLYHALKYN